MFKKIRWLLVAITAIAAWQARPVQASATDFGVAAIPAANQVDQSHHYFDLLVTPGSTQTLAIQIQNTASSSQRYEVSPNRATTSSTGDTDYSVHSPQKPASLPVDIETLLPNPKVYTVDPRATRTIRLKLTAPKVAWDGILLGAIHVQKLTGNSTQASGMAATASVAYNIGVQLRATKDLPAQAPKLGFDGVKRKSVSDGAQVFAQLDNPASAIQSGLSVTAKVYKGDKLVQSNASSNLRMAPNSVMSYPTDPKGTRLAPGDYRLDVTAKNGDASWHFTRAFTIAKTVIKTTKPQKQASTSASQLRLPTWLLAALIGLVLVLIATVWKLTHKHK